eukprot:2399887-Rhodomonas_salina.2
MEVRSLATWCSSRKLLRLVSSFADEQAHAEIRDRLVRLTKTMQVAPTPSDCHDDAPDAESGPHPCSRDCFAAAGKPLCNLRANHDLGHPKLL